MTTIILTDKGIGADRMMSIGSRIGSIDTVKAFQLKASSKHPGLIIGFSGDCAYMTRVIDHIQEHGDLSRAPGIPGEWQCLLRFQDEDNCWFGDSAGFVLQPLPYAIGSGANYALGASRAGADLWESISIACSMDVYSGGEPHVIEFL